jgi:hypothetical protein
MSPFPASGFKEDVNDLGEDKIELTKSYVGAGNTVKLTLSVAPNIS